MRTVEIGELQDVLGSCLEDVRAGEEVVIEDGHVPVARIVPCRVESEEQREARLVASGVLTAAKKKMDWDAFFKLPTGNVPHDVAVRAAIEGRGDR